MERSPVTEALRGKPYFRKLETVMVSAALHFGPHYVVSHRSLEDSRLRLHLACPLLHQVM